MKSKIIYLLFLLPLFTFAQSKLIGGVIKDADGNLLPGVSVVNMTTELGNLTDFDGNFTIKASEGDVLKISYIGMETKDITVGASNKLDVVLTASVEQIEEVVVVGYGVSTKRDLVGSISTVKAEDIELQPAANAVESIQGLTTGIEIVESGEPGEAPVVRIRGLGTAGAGRDPLYVVDGIMVDDINDINSQDISSMEILKDASSLAIYGSRGANGVIIVTTKQGAVGGFKVGITTYTGVKSILKDVDVANGADYQQYNYEQILNSGLDPDEVNERMPYGKIDPNQPSEYDTDWFDEITRLGRENNYNVNLSGGTEKVKEYLNLGLYTVEDVLKNNDYERITARNNITYYMTDKLTFTNMLSFTLEDKNKMPNSAFTKAYRQAPIVPVFDEDGAYTRINGETYNTANNPVAQLEQTNDITKQKTFKGAFTFNYKPNKNLSIKTNFGINRKYITQNKYTVGAAFLANDPNYDPDEEADVNLTVKSKIDTRWVFDLYGTYKVPTFDNNSFKILFGTTAERKYDNFVQSVYQEVPYGDFDFSPSDGSLMRSKSDRSTVQSLRSYIARVNYDYDRKYLVTLTGRRDGSSQFSEGNRWGNFYSVGAGWVVSSEDFMYDVEFVDFLKLKASWGQLGNQNVVLQAETFTNQLNYATGVNDDLNFQTLNQGSTFQNYIDDELTWEVTQELDLGFEVTMFDNRLSGEFDYYNKVNTNAILKTTLPGVFGVFDGQNSDPVYRNIARIKNEGTEFSLNWTDNIGEDFTYSIGGNLTNNSNIVESLTGQGNIETTGGQIIEGGITTKLLAVGQPIGSWYLNTFEGVDPETGNPVYKDVDGDGTIGVSDREFHGSGLPTYSYGLNLKLNYKKFDFTVIGYGTGGAKLYNAKKQQRYSYENIEQSVFDNRWTTPGQITNEPKALANDERPSTYFLEDGDYFRINNITLGYTLEGDFIPGTSIRIYGTAKNPFLFTNYSGYNPSLAGAAGETEEAPAIKGDPMGNYGMEYVAYPATKLFIIGTQINF